MKQDPGSVAVIVGTNQTYEISFFTLDQCIRFLCVPHRSSV